MQRDPSGVAFKAVISGAMHFDFTDIAPSPVVSRTLGVVGVGGRDVHDILSASVLRFLRQYNHPRAPEAAAPSADELERLREVFSSHARWPRARRRTASRRGTRYKLPRSRRGRRRRAETASARGTAEISKPTEDQGWTDGPSGITTIDVAWRTRARRYLASTSSRAWRHYRRSFDATHLPENWMELESIPGSPSKIDEDEDDVDLSVEVSPDETDAEDVPRRLVAEARSIRILARVRPHRALGAFSRVARSRGPRVPAVAASRDALAAALGVDLGVGRCIARAQLLLDRPAKRRTGHRRAHAPPAAGVEGTDGGRRRRSRRRCRGAISA